MTANRLTLRLTGKLELFTHALPVPVVAYFSYLSAGFKSLEEALVVLAAGTLGAGVPIVIAVIWRSIRIRGIFEEISEVELGHRVDIYSPFKQLIRYPFFEAKLIVARWILGLTVAHLFVAAIYGFQMRFWGTVPFALLQVVPVSFIVHLFITEDMIRPILLTPALVKGARMELPDLPRLGYFPRMVMSIAAVAVLPIVTLSYLIVMMVRGMVHVDWPLLHIGILLVLVVTAMLIVSYLAARAVRHGLATANLTLAELGRGNLNITSTRTSADEFGDQTQLLSRVIVQLRDQYDEIKTLNETLEDRVKKRTEELNRTLEKVNELRVQQDGDYFLTSLLMKPLGSNRAVSSTVTIDFLVRQKKTFEFRRWKEEIGGDICSAHTIYLQDGRPHTLFVNADAMGKSIQGAGGAIVFGAVLASIVERSLLAPETLKTSPERWLKNSFVELQRVFESFDGTMLISAFLGLIDDERGTLYYINAEHPHTVLLRGGRAEFLPGQPMFYKLGTSGLDSAIHVRTFRLLPEDVLIGASDGRDDLGVAKEAQRVTLDEQIFLRVVEDCKGMLDQIDALRLEQGGVGDDFSVVRVSYLEDRPVPEKPAIDVRSDLISARELVKAEKSDEARSVLESALNGARDNVEVLTPLARLCVRSGDFVKGAEYALRSLDIDPSDTKLLFLASFALKRTGRFAEAAEIGERVRIREPLLVKNLVNLAEVHLRLGALERTEQILEEGFRAAPGHPRLKKIQSILHGRKHSR